LDNNRANVTDLGRVIGKVNGIPGISRPVQEVICMHNETTAGGAVKDPNKRK
jgi:hypothetical protein